MYILRAIILATVFVIHLSLYSLATAASFNSSDVPKAIPDNSSTTSLLTVPQGACASVTDVNVSIDVTHPFIQDLAIRITHVGSGASALIFDGSCTSNNDLHAIFDDEAATIVQCPPNGVYKPEFPLSALDGIDASGTWTLTVADQSTLDTGTLEGWGITLSCGGSPQVTVAVNGNGSVNSSPGGIACTFGICSAQFTPGQAVDLTATAVTSPTLLSHFFGWAGGCDSTNGAGCSFTMNGERNILATFITNPPVQIPGDSFYTSLQAAYDAPGAPDITILSQAVELPALDFNLNSGKTVLLKGGFDSAYSGNSNGNTSMEGVLTVSSGSLTVENVMIR